MSIDELFQMQEQLMRCIELAAVADNVSILNDALNCLNLVNTHIQDDYNALRLVEYMPF